MQELTLEIIQRVIFGATDPELKDALRSALDLTQSTPNLIAMSLVQRDIGPYGRFLKAIERIDELVYQRIDEPSHGDSILDLLRDSGATREELRDQLVTLLAAGHETTATALAWALERLARHPRTSPPTTRRLHQRGPATRPVLSITARKTLQPYPLGDTRSRKASTSRRASTSRIAAAPLQARSQRPEPFTYIPLGGGTRRCLGAAFANWSCARCYEP